jgi:NADH:ubiquinone oxidoreductase subunit H
LVSGFNTEYSGAFFAFIFLSEYGMLLFSCFFIVFIYFCWFVSFNSVVVVVGMRVILSYVFIWVRITFCRFRYDLLMIRAWKVLLPVVLIVFICLVFLIV